MHGAGSLHGLGFRLHRGPGHHPFGTLEPPVDPFFGISSLSLACFFLLRKLVRRSIEEIRQLAYFDTLTGLPNRRLFTDRAAQALLLARRDTALFAILILDVDKFKRIKEMLGHRAGDELLCEVAKRLAVGPKQFIDT